MRKPKTAPTTITLQNSDGTFLFFITRKYVDDMGNIILRDAIAPALNYCMFQRLRKRQDILDWRKRIGYLYLNNYNFTQCIHRRKVTYSKPTFQEVLLWTQYMKKFKNVEKKGVQYEWKYIRLCEE